MDDLVSVIMPCYNSEQYIDDSISSVLSQTYEKWELIIVDDASTDSSFQRIQEFAKVDDRVVPLKNEVNLGGAATRNKAIGVAKGKYIAFLDSDDMWEASKLMKHINYMQEKGIGFTYSNYLQFNDKQPSVKTEIVAPVKVNYANMIKVNFIGCLTVVYDASVFGKFYFPLVKKRHDYALWLIMLKQFDYAYNIGDNLAQYRVHGSSLSADKRDLFRASFHVLHSQEKISAMKSFLYTLVFGILAKIKKKQPRLYQTVASVYCNLEFD